MRIVFNFIIRIFSRFKMNKVENTQMVVGKHTYGFENINVAWQQNEIIVIGAFCSIAGNITIQLGGNHNSNWITTYPFGHLPNGKFKSLPVPGHPKESRKVEIGNDVWIANNVTLMGGVIIHDGAIIAMNSHVTRNIPPFEIWGGNPAKKIKDRFPEEIKLKLLELKWWEQEDLLIEKLIPYLVQEPTAEILHEIEEEISSYNKISRKNNLS
jgi:acetyltransferase-like isoleucine patch superfamily enzyme